MIAQVLPEVDLPVSITLALETMCKGIQNTTKSKCFVAMTTPEAAEWHTRQNLFTVLMNDIKTIS